MLLVPRTSSFTFTCENVYSPYSHINKWHSRFHSVGLVDGQQDGISHALCNGV